MLVAGSSATGTHPPQHCMFKRGAGGGDTVGTDVVGTGASEGARTTGDVVTPAGFFAAGFLFAAGFFAAGFFAAGVLVPFFLAAVVVAPPRCFVFAIEIRDGMSGLVPTTAESEQTSS